MSDLFQASSAILSDCGQYRYRLERRWDSGLPLVAFIMLNPSTADAEQDDPTIRRCIGFAKTWGYGGLVVGNLFALRSTDPKALYGHADPIGRDNDAHLLSIAGECHQVIAAWGTHGALGSRGAEVATMLNGFNLSLLKRTAGGFPGHPLYIAAATIPTAFFSPASTAKDADHG
ncbi:DUF1643 domain-containing protein [Shinella sp.]|uniref:DUF1643 domain-containing protein n=1 Tax=Shinella sp. TaxID=1870904 RepID=UPI0028B09C51|nr:DUF1643 domain-containing protein [Shinella sp.]